MSNETPQDEDLTPDENLAEIVAYLDGELEEPAVELMERRLVGDAPLRRFADSLDQTWNLLDSLEEVTASGDFARRTLSSIAVLEKTEAKAEPKPSITLREWVRTLNLPMLTGWAVLGFVTAGTGLAIGRFLADRASNSSETLILQQLPLLEQYHHYRVVPDAGFLKDLSLPDASEDAPNPAGGRIP